MTQEKESHQAQTQNPITSIFFWKVMFTSLLAVMSVGRGLHFNGLDFSNVKQGMFLNQFNEIANVHFWGTTLIVSGIFLIIGILSISLKADIVLIIAFGFSSIVYLGLLVISLRIDVGTQYTHEFAILSMSCFMACIREVWSIWKGTALSTRNM